MEILTIIKDYIKEPNTDYAILINGAWGSGKTHFLKNSVGKRLRKSLFCRRRRSKRVMNWCM
jgi:predicted AAA+ superfamily ATPase